MAFKQNKNSRNTLIHTPAEQAHRVLLAGLGLVAIAHKRGLELFSCFVEEGKDLQARTTTLVREVGADTQAQAIGVFAPITARVEKQTAEYTATFFAGVERVLARFGIPAKRDIEDLSRQVAALSRKFKTAK